MVLLVSILFVAADSYVAYNETDLKTVLSESMSSEIPCWQADTKHLPDDGVLIVTKMGGKCEDTALRQAIAMLGEGIKV